MFEPRALRSTKIKIGNLVFPVLILDELVGSLKHEYSLTTSRSEWERGSAFMAAQLEAKRFISNPVSPTIFMPQLLQREGSALCGGDSGAPLFNQKGQVIAIFNFIFPGIAGKYSCQQFGSATYLPYYQKWIDSFICHLIFLILRK